MTSYQKMMMNNPMMNDPVFTAYDYAIGGKLVQGKVILDASYEQLLDTDQEARMKIKTALVHQLAEYMLENKLVEFTQVTEPMTYRKAVFVRAYVAPDDQVKILRVANKIV